MKALLARSRTIWGAIIVAIAGILPLLAEHISELQAVAIGLGLPAWTKYAIQGFGIAMVVYARWDDARTGTNPA